MNFKKGAAVAVSGVIVLATIWYLYSRKGAAPKQSAPIVSAEPVAKEKQHIRTSTPVDRPSQAALQIPLTKESPRVAHDESVPLKRVAGESLRGLRINEWRNVGKESLANAVQSQFWAMAQGDVDLLEQSIVVDETAREELIAVIRMAPESVRSQYATPERFAAFLLAGNDHEVRGFIIHSQRPTSETETRVIVDTLDRFSGPGGYYPHDEYFRKGEDGAWRRVITNKMAKGWRAMFVAPAPVR